MNENEILGLIPRVLAQLLALTDLPAIRWETWSRPGAAAHRSSRTILVNPQWFARVVSPFRTGWGQRERIAFIVGVLAHELGHLVHANVSGRAGEAAADDFAARVLAHLRLPAGPMSLFLFTTHEDRDHVDGGPRMDYVEKRWALHTFFPNAGPDTVVR